MKRFNEFAQEQHALEGDKMRIDDILNTEIIICGFDVRTSRYTKNKSGKYLTIQFQYLSEDEKLFIAFTGSDILIDQMLKYESEIPFIAIIKKINRYYTLS
jgi:hypothetical protein